MSLLTVGTVAFDTIETPYGREEIRNWWGLHLHQLCRILFYQTTYTLSAIVIGGDFPQC